MALETHQLLVPICHRGCPAEHHFISKKKKTGCTTPYFVDEQKKTAAVPSGSLELLLKVQEKVECTLHHTQHWGYDYLGVVSTIQPSSKPPKHHSPKSQWLTSDSLPHQMLCLSPDTQVCISTYNFFRHRPLFLLCKVVSKLVKSGAFVRTKFVRFCSEIRTCNPTNLGQEIYHCATQSYKHN